VHEADAVVPERPPHVAGGRSGGRGRRHDAQGAQGARRGEEHDEREGSDRAHRDADGDDEVHADDGGAVQGAGPPLAEQHGERALVLAGVEGALVDVLADEDGHDAEPVGHRGEQGGARPAAGDHEVAAGDHERSPHQKGGDLAEPELLERPRRRVVRPEEQGAGDDERHRRPAAQRHEVDGDRRGHRGENEESGDEQPRAHRAAVQRVHRVAPARRVVGVVAAPRAEVVVGEIAHRVQHDVPQHDEQEGEEREAAVGRGDEAGQQRRLERDDEDDAARRVQKAGDGVEGREVVGERRVEAGEGARPLARAAAGGAAPGWNGGRGGVGEGGVGHRRARCRRGRAALDEGDGRPER
jgi:hypothetical protein